MTMKIFWVVTPYNMEEHNNGKILLVYMVSHSREQKAVSFFVLLFTARHGKQQNNRSGQICGSHSTDYLDYGVLSCENSVLGRQEKKSLLPPPSGYTMESAYSQNCWYLCRNRSSMTALANRVSSQPGQHILQACFFFYFISVNIFCCSFI